MRASCETVPNGVGWYLAFRLGLRGRVMTVRVTRVKNTVTVMVSVTVTVTVTITTTAKIRLTWRSTDRD